MDSLSSLYLFVRNPLLCTYTKKDTCQEVSSYQQSIICLFFLIFSQSELCWRLPHCKPMQPIICSLNDWLIFMSKVNLRFLCIRKCFCITSLKKKKKISVIWSHLLLLWWKLPSNSSLSGSNLLILIVWKLFLQKIPSKTCRDSYSLAFLTHIFRPPISLFHNSGCLEFHLIFLLTQRLLIVIYIYSNQQLTHCCQNSAEATADVSLNS